MLMNEPAPPYSDENWRRYLPLIREVATIRTKVQETLAANPGVAAPEVVTAALELRSILETLQLIYEQLPQLAGTREPLFRGSFN